jgi:5-methylcytosine-specific restriction protein A
MAKQKLGRLVKNYAELESNLNKVEDYLGTGVDAMIKLIGRGTNLVAYKVGEDYHFAPSRFIGYLNNDLDTHLQKGNGKDGRETSTKIDKIIKKERKYDDDLEKSFIAFCKVIGATPKNMTRTQRKYWEYKSSETFKEGRNRQISINRYERSADARKKCIEHHGTSCAVCGLSFKDKYGSLGNGFIHVHHIIPISEIGGEYNINPINDLMPVCPNCHAMLHKGNLSIDELKLIIEQNSCEASD